MDLLAFILTIGGGGGGGGWEGSTDKEKSAAIEFFFFCLFVLGGLTAACDRDERASFVVYVYA